MVSLSAPVTETALALFDRSVASIERAVVAGASAQVEEVHQLRVGIKRVRAVIGLARAIDPAFDGGSGEKMLRRVFRGAAGLRDLDVQLALTRRVAEESQVNAVETIRALESQRPDALARFSASAAKYDISKMRSLRSTIEGSLNALDERAVATISRATLHDWVSALSHSASEDLHDLRKRTKRAHALSWILARADGDRATRALETRLDGVQKLLGDWHDLSVAHELAVDEEYRQETLSRTGVGEKKVRRRFADLTRRGAFTQRS